VIDTDDLPFIVDGNTESATVEGFNSSALSCDFVPGDTNVVWYELTAKEDKCMSLKVAADFTASIAVYSGECEGLSCVGQAGYGDRDTVLWQSVTGTTYKIAVASSFSYNKAGGDFTIIVTVRIAVWELELL
jgi:hypothetical protein